MTTIQHVQLVNSFDDHSTSIGLGFKAYIRQLTDSNYLALDTYHISHNFDVSSFFLWPTTPHTHSLFPPPLLPLPLFPSTPLSSPPTHHRSHMASMYPSLHALSPGDFLMLPCQ